MRHKPMPGTQLRTDHHWSVQGLKLFLPLSMGGGLSARDIAGGNHGEILGATWGPGKYGPALNFPGTNEYVNIGDNGDVGTSDFTLSARVKKGDTGNEGIISKEGIDPRYYMINFNNVTRCLVDDGVNTVYADGTANWQDNQWHLITCTVDRSEASGITIYLDGIDDTNTRTGDLSSVGNLDNPNNLKIGYQPEGYFTGKIDNVSLYNVALTAAQVWELSQNPHIPFEPEMVPMWQPSAGTIYYATPSDAILLTESNIKTASLVDAESIIASESPALLIDKVKADSIILSETNIKTVSLVDTEGVTILESPALLIEKIEAEAVSVSESIIKSMQLKTADTALISESTAQIISKAMVDSIIVSEAAIEVFAVTVSDSVIVSEATIQSIQLVITEIISATESVLKVLDIQIADTSIIVDAVISSVLGQIFGTASDAVNVSDVATFIKITGPPSHKTRKEYISKVLQEIDWVEIINIDRTIKEEE